MEKEVDFFPKYSGWFESASEHRNSYFQNFFVFRGTVVLVGF